jgi:hypothetical protein
LQYLNQAATNSDDTQSKTTDTASNNTSSLLALNLHKTPFTYAHINSTELKTEE